VVGDVNWVLSGKNFSVRFESMEYLQIWGGDFASPAVRVRESRDE
jgi:hypothetical protein